MREGLVVSASTPVAPGIESLLLRSGRITEADWSEVFAEAAPYGRLAAALVERDLIGAATVEVLTQTAVFDAIFAIALCGINTCTAERVTSTDLAPLLPADPGLAADRVVRETARRLHTAAEWHRFGLTIYSRPYRTNSEHRAAIVPSRGEILAEVNGRLTARDIAFSLGRGLYSVLTDLAILIADGLVAMEGAASLRPPMEQPRRSEPASTTDTDARPEVARPEDAGPEGARPPGQAAELPRRRRLGKKKGAEKRQ